VTLDSRTVWVVLDEFQADTPDVAGVFDSREKAEAFAQARRVELREQGFIVWPGPDEDVLEDAEWTVTVRVSEPQEVE